MTVRSCFGRWKATAAFMGLACGVLLAAPDALATISGANGKIAFKGDTAISVMNPNGTGIRRLTNNSGHVFPDWSPEGTRIAFHDGEGISTMNADGSGRKTLTGFLGGLFGGPSWSPDGQRIAFAQSGGIYVVNADGSGAPTQLSFGADWSPAWSPDGNWIAFVRRHPATGNWQVFRMDSDGTDETPLTPEGSDFVGFLDWSPDSEKIVFERSDGTSWQVWIMDADGSDATQLTFTGNSYNPTWAPDGTKIGFASSRSPGLWTMNPDGSDQVRIGPANPFSMPDWQPVHVRIRPSASTVTFGRAVRITAHLVHETTPNAEVSVYKIPQGGSEILVGSGLVDASGDFTVTDKPGKHTRYVARWSGDSEHPAGGASDSILVRVRAAVTGRLLGFYGTAGAYRLYHFTSRCSQAGRSCPKYSATVAPRHAGKRLYIRLQVFAGRWRTVLLFSVRIPASGPNVVRFVYSGRAVIGVRTRTRAEFRADADHLGNTAPWAYFKVTG